MGGKHCACDERGFWQLETPQTPCAPPEALMVEQVFAGGLRVLTWRQRIRRTSLGVPHPGGRQQAEIAAASRHSPVHSHLLGELEQGCAPSWFFMWECWEHQQLTSSTSAGPSTAPWSSVPPAEPQALCLSCLPAAGVADGVARSHQLCLPHRGLLPSAGGLQEDDPVQGPQPATPTSDYQGRYVSASAFCASPFPSLPPLLRSALCSIGKVKAFSDTSPLLPYTLRTSRLPL